jgi:type IV pilus assembly protein PilN
MIRINLLPLRASRKKETIRQQLSIFALCVVGVLAVGLVAYVMLLNKISNAKADIQSAETEIQALKTKIGAMNDIKKLQDDVKKKLDVLNQLRRAKNGPAARLAALSDAVPEKLWLTKYAENGPAVTVSGMAASEELIAIFMKNLEASGAFRNVELQVSEQTETAGTKNKRFDLAFQIKEQTP